MDPNQKKPAPNATPEVQMASEADKKQLMKMIEDIRGKIGDVNAARFMGKNTAEESRQAALKKAFASLQKAGVDLNDPASVSQFLERLRQQNPELATQFEEAIMILLDGYNPKEVTPGNEAVQENMGGPSPDSAGAQIG